MGTIRKVRTVPEFGIPDEDTPELTPEMLARARPLAAILAERGLPPMGRPRLANPKQAVSLRLDPGVIAYFKAGGRGWQTRINAVLKAHVEAEETSR